MLPWIALPLCILKFYHIAIWGVWQKHETYWERENTAGSCCLMQRRCHDIVSKKLPVLRNRGQNQKAVGGIQIFGTAVHPLAEALSKDRRRALIAWAGVPECVGISFCSQKVFPTISCLGAKGLVLLTEQFRRLVYDWFLEKCIKSSISECFWRRVDRHFGIPSLIPKRNRKCKMEKRFR